MKNLLRALAALIVLSMPCCALAASPQTVATIAALRAGNFGSYPSVSVEEWYSGGNTGGGLFNYVASDTTTADNSCTVIVDAGGHRFYRNGVANVVTLGMCGAHGNGSTNDTTAVQAALSTLADVYADCDKQRTYLVSTTIRFKAQGQIFQGCGSGYTSLTGQTVIKWGGSAGGKVVSFAISAANAGVNGAILSNMDINGNSTAGLCVEVYDVTNPSGGNWRNHLENVWTKNCNNNTGALAKGTGTFLGTGSAPDFANDFSACGGGSYNDGNGFDGAGSTYELCGKGSIVQAAANGIETEAGSNWVVGGWIFHGNLVDVDFNNTGPMLFNGTWFENSTTAVFVAHTGINTQLNGTHLSTCNLSHLMQMNNAAGVLAINAGLVAQSSCGGGSTSKAISGVVSSSLNWSSIGVQNAPDFGVTETGAAFIAGPLVAAGSLGTTATVFASLPSCTSALRGQQQMITDSTTGTFGANITVGGGSNVINAVCTGTNWTVH